MMVLATLIRPFSVPSVNARSVYGFAQHSELSR